jgi:hypothetical protein
MNFKTVRWTSLPPARPLQELPAINHFHMKFDVLITGGGFAGVDVNRFISNRQRLPRFPIWTIVRIGELTRLISVKS